MIESIMRILYGSAPYHLLDITRVALLHLVRDNVIILPRGDNDRAYLFTDPIPNVVKVIKYIDDNGVETIIGSEHQAYVDLTDKRIYITDVPQRIKDIYPYETDGNRQAEIENKLREIHSTLTLVHGNMSQEFPEQGMAMRFLTGDEKVLEIGANVGRNSLLIHSILSKKGNDNFVTLESDSHIASQLKENRMYNRHRPSVADTYNKRSMRTSPHISPHITHVSAPADVPEIHLEAPTNEIIVPNPIFQEEIVIPIDTTVENEHQAT